MASESNLPGWEVPPFLRQFWRAKKYPSPPSFLFKKLVVTTNDGHNNNNNNDDTAAAGDQWPRPRPAKAHSLPNLGSLVDKEKVTVLPVARSSSLSRQVAVSCGPICQRQVLLPSGQQRLCLSCKRAKETRLRLMAARARAERAWWASRLPPPPPGDHLATRVPEQANEAAMDDEKV